MMFDDLSTRPAPTWRDLAGELSSKEVGSLLHHEQSGCVDPVHLIDEALGLVRINRYNVLGGPTPSGAATELAIHLERVGRMKFGELKGFLETSGITVSGSEAVIGEHVGRPHVDAGMTLFTCVSEQYVDAVASLFECWPVNLMIGDLVDFSADEEPWLVTWVGERANPSSGLAKRPAVNPDVHDIADRAKYNYAVGTERLATAQYLLAEMAGTGRVGSDDSKRVQDILIRVWEALYYGTTSAVRDWETPDCTWDEADNTYSDGRQVVTQTRAADWEHLDATWEFNSFLCGDGAVQGWPRGTVSHIALPPADVDRQNAGPHLHTTTGGDVAALRARLERFVDPRPDSTARGDVEATRARLASWSGPGEIR